MRKCIHIFGLIWQMAMDFDAVRCMLRYASILWFEFAIYVGNTPAQSRGWGRSVGGERVVEELKMVSFLHGDYMMKTV